MSDKLFQPIEVGGLLLQHRVVLAPLTRYRADKQHVPLPHVAEYYAQRASVPGTLMITEGTFIAQRAGGYDYVPGIWSDDQVAAWKNVTEAVHAKGSFIYLQLWALGRAATPSALSSEDSSLQYVAPSDIPIKGQEDSIPRPLSVPEIQEYIELYATAASNAVHRAGFDGVELHSANGYLVDQFLQDVSNVRTDAYGGNVENRARFALEIIDAIVRRVGERKTAIRLSPWSAFGDMGMQDPKPTFSYLVGQLRSLYPALSYIHVIEPLISNETGLAPAGQSNDFIREIWVGNACGAGSHDMNGLTDNKNETRRVIISAGRYTRDLGIRIADMKGDLIAYGRFFIANPDLPRRLLNNIQLTAPDRNYFYSPRGSMDPKGYTDYPFAEEEDEYVGHSLENKL